MTDLPLHVQTAEAIGWRPMRTVPGAPPWTEEGWVPNEGRYYGNPPLGDPGHNIALNACVPRYDEDWAATGPLIAGHHIHLGEERTLAESVVTWGQWVACVWESDEEKDYLVGYGPAPLIAVCNLILKLAEEGKLHADTDPVRR